MKFFPANENPSLRTTPYRDNQEQLMKKWLAPYKCVRLTRLLIPSGIGPLSWFSFTILGLNIPAKSESLLRNIKQQAEDGLDPYKTFRFIRLLIPSGMGPLSWFSCKHL